MIPPRKQWCIQVEVTNACNRRCSNCTRCVPHAKKPFFITPYEFKKCLRAVRKFITESEPDQALRNYGRKVIGMMGGEPTMHPAFDELCAIFREMIPHKENRGLWTGWFEGIQKHRTIIDATFGPASNYNFHQPPSQHQPILVGIQELVPDKDEMWRMIDACWLQSAWSSSITRKGFFFCEVAAALDEIFQGPGGLPIDDNCWRYDLDAYRWQMELWCPRCGCAAPLPGRIDNEEVDDISPCNLQQLRRIESPRIEHGQYKVFDVSGYDPREYQPDWSPIIYRTEQRTA